jgi:hypothetical protein
MNRYVLVPKHPAEYQYFLESLVKLGLELDAPKTVPEYINTWPLEKITAIVVNYSAFKKNQIGTITTGTTYEKSKPATWDEVVSDIAAEIITNTPKLPPPVFPPAAKYRITYRTERGEIKGYEISNPIESDANVITAYAFKRGVRSFKKDRITRCDKVG